MNYKNISILDIKKENRYLNHKESIRQFLSEHHWSDIIRNMIEDLDSIDDLNNSQSIEMFKLVSCLQDAINAYDRIFYETKN